MTCETGFHSNSETKFVEVYNTMRRLTTKKELDEQITQWRGESVGVVMTMGALHAGHLALVAAARQDNKRVIVTIFVNPKQFDRAEDLQNYPVETAQDVKKLQQAVVDAVYIPTVVDLYPPGYATQVRAETPMQNCLCGATRPGHLDGVTTVVSKLLIRTRADRAYFGQKDYQQFKLVERVACDLDLSVDIIGVPTVREDDGLALSSRNRRLNSTQRAKARCLYAVLNWAAGALQSGADWASIRPQAIAKLRRAGFERVDYFDLRGEDTLGTLAALNERENARLFVAAFLGTVRLIDNIPVGCPSKPQSSSSGASNCFL